MMQAKLQQANNIFIPTANIQVRVQNLDLWNTRAPEHSSSDVSKNTKKLISKIPTPLSNCKHI